MLLGFSLSFLVLYSAGSGSFTRPITVGQAEMNEDVSDQTLFFKSLLGSVGMMLGDFDLDSFSGTSNETAMSLLFVMFAYLVMVVLLNLLIAIMGDKYDEVLENGRAEYQYAKACMILEYEDFLSEKVTQ